jgi:hypothetical protein
MPRTLPTSAAACNWRAFGQADLVKAPVTAAVNPAPIIIAKSIKLLVFDKTELISARCGPGHVQKVKTCEQARGKHKILPIRQLKYLPI